MSNPVKHCPKKIIFSILDLQNLDESKFYITNFVIYETKIRLIFYQNKLLDDF